MKSLRLIAVLAVLGTIVGCTCPGEEIAVADPVQESGDLA